MKEYSVYLGISIMFFGMGILDFIGYLVFLKDSKVTGGEIIKLEWFWQEAGVKSSHYIYKFSVDSTIINGHSSNGIADPLLFEEGEKVKIRYNVENKWDNRIDHFSWSYCTLVKCLIASLISFFFWYRNRKI